MGEYGTYINDKVDYCRVHYFSCIKQLSTLSQTKDLRNILSQAFLHIFFGEHRPSPNPFFQIQGLDLF